MAPKKEGTKKKAAPKGGIKLGSAVKAMKSELGKSRLSENAAHRAIMSAEETLRYIARHSKAVLQTAGKKTLTLKILIDVLEAQGVKKHVLLAAQSGSTEKKRKDDRNVIATASVLRVVKKELGDLRISANAADALAHIAEACLKKIASGAELIARNDNRTTVKKRDVDTYVELNVC